MTVMLVLVGPNVTGQCQGDVRLLSGSHIMTMSGKYDGEYRSPDISPRSPTYHTDIIKLDVGAPTWTANHVGGWPAPNMMLK